MKLARDQRGAVLAEFAIACMPLMTTFFFFVELEQIGTASLVLKHSAVVGARAAAVISNTHRNTPDQADANNEDQVRSAVEAALGPWKPTMKNLTVQVHDHSSCADPYGSVLVEVAADYECSVPFARVTLCTNMSHRFHTISTAFPHQGARYHEGGGANCP